MLHSPLPNVTAAPLPPLLCPLHTSPLHTQHTLIIKRQAQLFSKFPCEGVYEPTVQLSVYAAYPIGAPTLVGCRASSKVWGPATSQTGGCHSLVGTGPPDSLAWGKLQLAGRDPGHGCSQLHSNQGHIPGIAGSFAVHTRKGHPCAHRQLLGPPPGRAGEGAATGGRGNSAVPVRAEVLLAPAQQDPVLAQLPGSCTQL